MPSPADDVLLRAKRTSRQDEPTSESDPKRSCVVEGTPRSEVALNANVEGQRALVVKSVGLGWLRSTRAEDRTTEVVLAEHEVQQFRRQRQVLDRIPAGDRADLADVEVRVASVGHAEAGMRESKDSAELRLSRPVVPHP